MRRFERRARALEINGSVPTDKRFNRVEFGQTNAIIRVGRRQVPVFRAAPEFSRVGTEEERAVLLGRVPENRFALLFGISRRERDGDFNLIERPFLPRASVEQGFGYFFSLFLHLL